MGILTIFYVLIYAQSIANIALRLKKVVIKERKSKV